jgi:hypothetical protein
MRPSFLTPMDYTRIYNSLIDRARGRIVEGYTESHHIVPRCMGGGDEVSNLVELTPEEHFLAHQLLVKMYPSNPKLLFAASMMIADSCGQRVNNKMFGWIKRKWVEAVREQRTGVPHSEETKQKIRESKIGRPRSEETKQKIRESKIGRSGNPRQPLTEEHKQKLLEANLGRHLSDEHKKKLSDSQKGKAKSEETKAKISAAHKGKKKSAETREKMRLAKLKKKAANLQSNQQETT